MQTINNSLWLGYELPPPVFSLTSENCPSTQNESPPTFPVTKVPTTVLPLLICRTKQLIADQLPKKTDKVVFCPLTATQRQAYENLLECKDVQLIKRRNEPCDCGRKPKLARGQCCFKVNAEGKTIEALVFPFISSFPAFLMVDT